MSSGCRSDRGDSDRGDSDRGALAIEYVIVAPMILLVLSLIYLFGDYASATGAIQAGTRDATRTATQARSYDDAETRARAAVLAQVGNRSKTCSDTLDVEVVGGAQQFQPGNVITVTATCTFPASDLFIGVPGDLHPFASFSSLLDPNRGINP